MKLARIEQVLAGKAVPYTRPGSFSAIAKQPVAGPVQVDVEGLQGDEQGDPKVHGGVNKAVHHYAYEHYARWRQHRSCCCWMSRSPTWTPIPGNDWPPSCSRCSRPPVPPC